MKNPQSAALGVLLSQEVNYSLKYIPELKENYFDVGTHREVFVACRNMINKGIKPDALNVIKALREEGQLVPGVASKISELSVFDHRSVLSFSSIIGVLKHEHSERIITKYIQDTQTSISNGVLTKDSFLTGLEDLKKELTTTEKNEKNNIEVIDMVIESHRKARSGEAVGLELPFTNLHRVVLLEDVDFMVIGARPAMGKTAHAVSVACGLAFMSSKKVALFALEMSKEQMMRRILAWLTGIDSNKIKYGNCNETELKQLEAVKKRPELQNIIIYEGSRTVHDITFSTTTLKHTTGVDLVIVDYVQKIKATKGQSPYEQISYNSNELKELSQQMKVPVLGYAQLGRSVEQRGGDRRPRLSDLRETGHLEQDASIVAFLYRAEYYGIYEDEDGNSTQGVGELIIAKNREGELGQFKYGVDFTTSKWKDFTGNAVLMSSQSSFDVLEDDNPF